jgi:hypothetical protein
MRPEEMTLHRWFKNPDCAYLLERSSTLKIDTERVIAAVLQHLEASQCDLILTTFVDPKPEWYDEAIKHKRVLCSVDQIQCWVGKTLLEEVVELVKDIHEDPTFLSPGRY